MKPFWKSVTKTSLNNIIIDSKPLDEGFAIVLLMIDNDLNRYTTHLHNVEHDSITNGRYFTKLSDTINDFKDRE